MMSTSPSSSPPPQRYTLSVYVPESSLADVKAALFAAGAGTYPGGKYSQVCFQTKGQDQFLPNEGAVPNIGTVGQVQTVQETKIEIICVGREVMERSVRELKSVHPYEEVPYQVFKMEDV